MYFSGQTTCLTLHSIEHSPTYNRICYKSAHVVVEKSKFKIQTQMENDEPKDSIMARLSSNTNL